LVAVVPSSAELLIDCEEDRTLRPVIVGMLRPRSLGGRTSLKRVALGWGAVPASDWWVGWLASTGVDRASVRADPTTEPLSIPRRPPVDAVGRARKGLGQYSDGEAEGKEASERTYCW
jgi:hypothetical protein